MALKELDSSIKFPIADMVFHNGHTYVASYDRIIRVYNENNLIDSINIPSPICKLYSYKQYILGISMKAGALYIIDKNHSISDVIYELINPISLIILKNGFLVLSLNNSIQVFNECENIS